MFHCSRMQRRASEWLANRARPESILHERTVRSCLATAKPVVLIFTMTEYREWDYRNEILTTSKKWYRCDIAHCGRTFASERNCALHIHAHHPGRFRCDIGGCAAVFDLRTPFTRHVLKEHQQFVPDGAFTTASASKQKPAKAKRSRKIPEGFSLIDITSRLDFEPSDKQLFPLAPIPSPPSAVNSSDWASPRVGHPQSRPVGCPDTDRSSYDKNRRDIKRRVSLIEEPITYRVIRARLGKHRPDYEVHQSAIHPGQQCGIDWASEAGKLNFDRVFKSLIGRMGGVKPSHQGSCVLCPEALRSMNLSDLRGTDPTLLPDRTADPIKFYYSDYATSFPRATAWYQGGRWPRAGAELDGLIGANGLLPMDATYLCHQEHCVIHLAWESVEHKSSREHCAVSAREARQAGRPLPKHCSEHTPPCLLQVRFHKVSDVIVTDVVLACGSC